MSLDKFTKNNVIMFAASITNSACNLLYQLLMLRILTAGAFASLNTLISLLTIIAVPSVSFTAMVTKHISKYSAQATSDELKSIWRIFFKHAFIFALSVFIIIFIFRAEIANFLKIDSAYSLIILGGIFFILSIFPIVAGTLQGLEKFGWLAAALVLGGASKLAISYVFVKNISYLEGALLGILASGFLSFLLGFFPIRNLLQGKCSIFTNVKKLYFFILPTTLVAFCFSVLTNIDMVLVKHFFTLEPQNYAKAQMIGKIIFFIPGMIYAVMFARVSRLHAAGNCTKNILKRSMLFTFILSFSVVAGYNLMPHFTAKALLGSFNPEIISLGRIFSFTMFFYAMSNILFFYQLSIENYAFIKYLILAAVVQVLLIYLIHQTPFLIAGIVFCVSLLIFIHNLILVFGKKNE